MIILISCLEGCSLFSRGAKGDGDWYPQWDPRIYFDSKLRAFLSQRQPAFIARRDSEVSYRLPKTLVRYPLPFYLAQFYAQGNQLELSHLIDIAEGGKWAHDDPPISSEDRFRCLVMINENQPTLKYSITHSMIPWATVAQLKWAETHFGIPRYQTSDLLEDYLKSKTHGDVEKVKFLLGKDFPLKNQLITQMALMVNSIDLLTLIDPNRAKNVEGGLTDSLRKYSNFLGHFAEKVEAPSNSSFLPQKKRLRPNLVIAVITWYLKNGAEMSFAIKSALGRIKNEDFQRSLNHEIIAEK